MIGSFMAITNHKRKIQLVCNFQRSREITLLMSIQFIFYLGDWKFECGCREMAGESLNCNVVASLHLQSFFEVTCSKCRNVSKNLSCVPKICTLTLNESLW